MTDSTRRGANKNRMKQRESNTHLIFSYCDEFLQFSGVEKFLLFPWKMGLAGGGGGSHFHACPRQSCELLSLIPSDIIFASLRDRFE